MPTEERGQAAFPTCEEAEGVRFSHLIVDAEGLEFAVGVN